MLLNASHRDFDLRYEFLAMLSGLPQPLKTIAEDLGYLHQKHLRRLIGDLRSAGHEVVTCREDVGGYNAYIGRTYRTSIRVAEAYFDLVYPRKTGD